MNSGAALNNSGAALSALSFKDPVVFTDSGIGGIYYCAYFAKRCSRDIIAVADNAHFPYGTKSKEEVAAVTEELAGKIIKTFSPAVIALACNTASVSALARLREKFPGTVFVGTVPAVKPAMLQSTARHIVTLGTERTVNDPYLSALVKDITKNHNAGCRISGIAAPELVGFVENHFFSAAESEKERVVMKYIEQVRRLNADGIVLGCTHFLFLAGYFQRLAAPHIRIYDSAEGVCGRIIHLLQSGSARGGGQNPGGGAGAAGAANKVLLLTKDDGPENAGKWEHFAKLFGAGVKNFPDVPASL